MKLFFVFLALLISFSTVDAKPRKKARPAKAPISFDYSGVWRIEATKGPDRHKVDLLVTKTGTPDLYAIHSSSPLRLNYLALSPSKNKSGQKFLTLRIAADDGSGNAVIERQHYTILEQQKTFLHLGSAQMQMRDGKPDFISPPEKEVLFILERVSEP